MILSTTSNLGDLTPYVEDDFDDLGENPSQEEEVNAYCVPSPKLTPGYSLSHTNI